MVRIQQHLLTASVHVYYHVVLFCQQMDGPPLLTTNVCSGDNESSATAQTQ